MARLIMMPTFPNPEVGQIIDPLIVNPHTLHVRPRGALQQNIRQNHRPLAKCRKSMENAIRPVTICPHGIDFMDWCSENVHDLQMRAILNQWPSHWLQLKLCTAGSARLQCSELVLDFTILQLCEISHQHRKYQPSKSAVMPNDYS